MAIGEGANYTIIKDPDGQMASGVLTENASVSVTFQGVNDVPGGRFSLYFMPNEGAVDEYQFGISKFQVEPAYDIGCMNAVRIIDTDGSFPAPTDRDWIINNETRIENTTFTLEKNLTVIDKGNLIIRNSTILVNSTETNHLEITVGVRGRMEILNATIRPANLTGHDYWENRYWTIVMGELRMYGSSVLCSATPGFHIFSEDVIINDSFADGISCTDCSPIISNNTLGYLILRGSSAQVSNNTFGDFVFPGDWTGTKPYPQGISIGSGADPLIKGNTFLDLDEAILSDNYAHPRIVANQFKDCDIGISFDRSYGLVDGNTFRNLSTGIYLEYGFSSVDISNNDISASKGIQLEWFNTATITNNTFQDYIDYGVFSNGSFTRLRGNSFHPGENVVEGSFGARVQWITAFGLVDEEMRDVSGFGTSKVTVKNSQGSVIRSNAHLDGDTPIIDRYPTLFLGILPEIQIGRDGKEIRCNPYTAYVEHLGFKGSIKFNVNRTSTFYILLTQKQAPLVNGTYLVLIIIGMAVVVRLVAPKVAQWLEVRRARKLNRPPPVSHQAKIQSDVVEWRDSE